MEIAEFRIYAEVLEQGIDFKEYLNQICPAVECKNIYTKKTRGEIVETDSLVARIRKSKDIDVLITAVSGRQEYPLLMVEYSMAVPTDDHKMQRSDVYYWSSVYKVAVMKIYPSNKGMGQDFGGGDKFTDDAEAAITFRQGGVFYPVQWETQENSNILAVKENALSCIYYCQKIKDILQSIISLFTEHESYFAFFNDVRERYRSENQAVLNEWPDERLKGLIVDSSRFRWDNGKLTVKINRFGHAMDPDRGVLYFASMLNGKENCNTEIQVNRSSVNGRQGYKSLFDACAREAQLIEYANDIFENQDNVFTVQDALHIFSYALLIESYSLFKQASEYNFFIEDEKLASFLRNCTSITSKCIFFLSTTLLLTDASRNVICRVTWNSSVVDEYLSSLSTTNTAPTIISPLTASDAKEDIITYASCELYKKLGCELLAVSYPGAQGDRCILNGAGRKVLRTYIDIIALKRENTRSTVLLEECKSAISKSERDVIKLHSILEDAAQFQGLKVLVENLSGENFPEEVKISIGAKYADVVPPYDVDYIFMFMVNSRGNNTFIDYYVALIDTTLVEMFAPLKDERGRLKGTLVLDKLYIIN